MDNLNYLPLLCCLWLEPTFIEENGLLFNKVFKDFLNFSYSASVKNLFSENKTCSMLSTCFLVFFQACLQEFHEFKVLFVSDHFPGKCSEAAYITLNSDKIRGRKNPS